MKLYWRYKKNGRWTWTAADLYNDEPNEERPLVLVYQKTEEV